MNRAIKRNPQEHYNIRDRSKWRVISVAGDAEVSQAADMADRFNRLFLRTLRQLRDLRRYSLPVMINNPQQVNIAADGGQQVNLQKGSRGRRKASPRKIRSDPVSQETSRPRIMIDEAGVWEIRAGSRRHLPCIEELLQYGED